MKRGTEDTLRKAEEFLIHAIYIGAMIHILADLIEPRLLLGTWEGRDTVANLLGPSAIW